MPEAIRRIALLVCIVPIVAVAAAVPVQAAGETGATQVTVDFTSYGSQGNFDPLFYRYDGIVFPPQRCGSLACADWFIGYAQGDETLVGGDLYGDVRATFTRPVSKLALVFAQGIQGVASYRLIVYDAKGVEIASTAQTVVQDEGVRQPVVWGDRVIELGDFARPAKSFVLEGRMIYSSFPLYQHIEYGVKTIAYTHWGSAR